ncbi:MAG: protein translocase SEC61 complex subunit gamma [Candidatus Nanoarchaeia archaeon]
MFNLKSFAGQCLRVWKLLRKPSSTEFKTIAKVSALGLAAIGLIGFIVSLLVGKLDKMFYTVG